MKKTIMMTAVAAALLTGSVMTSCDSKEKKMDEAQQKVDEAKDDLKDAKNDAKAELNAEYPAYRTDAEARIAENDKKIADLREKISKGGGGKPLDPARQKRIDELQQRNSDLRARLLGYEKEKSDWETFKREFNHDMDELGNSMKDIGKDNVK